MTASGRCWTALKFAEQIRAFAVRQADVEKNQVEIILGKQVLCRGDRGRGGDLVAALAQLLLQVLPNDQLIFQDDDFLNGHAGERGC